jgi:hypothetical protein
VPEQCRQVQRRLPVHVLHIHLGSVLQPKLLEHHVVATSDENDKM